MKKLLPVLIGAAILVSAGSFYGGIAYANAKSPTRSNFQRTSASGGQANMMNGGASGQGNRRGGMMTGGFIAGEVLSNDGKTLTIKGNDGSSKIVLLSEATEVSLFTAGKIDNLEVGKNVMVQGKANTDGSITAQSIQLRPLPTPPTNAPQGVQTK